MESLIQDQEYLIKLTILLVEDDEAVRELCKMFLSSVVGVLITAANGVEGLRAFNEYHPDIIITDIQMPTMDGLSLTREIRKIDLNIPIVILSAFAHNSYLLKAIDLNIDKYITKPLKRVPLHNALLGCAHRLRTEANSQLLATVQERNRLACDLHDGLLQSLTVAALQMEMAQRLIDADPQKAKLHLLESQNIITAEQRGLRSHIQHLKPIGTNAIEHSSLKLSTSLDELASRIKRHWGLSVEIDYDSNLCIPHALYCEIYFLLHEALINAAHHAQASSVRVVITHKKDMSYKISISDNGKGFPFQGRYNLTALQKNNVGPFTLMERTSHLGGSLDIHSHETGSLLEFTLPITIQGGDDANTPGNC
jgi:signal transduction histidine kinase